MPTTRATLVDIYNSFRLRTVAAQTLSPAQWEMVTPHARVLRALRGRAGGDCTGASDRAGCVLYLLLFSRCCPPCLLYP